MNTSNLQDNLFSLQDAIIIARSMVTTLADKTKRFEILAVEAEYRLNVAETAAKELRDALR